jgi:hypothetical protein
VTGPGPTLWYCNGLKKAIDRALALGTPKAMFVTAAYTMDQDAHDYIDDVSAHQATGTGVAAGGVTLTSVTTTVDGASNLVKLDAADISGISVTACYVVVYVDTGTPSTSPVLTITDLSAGDAVDSVWTAVVWDANGITGVSAA